MAPPPPLLPQKVPLPIWDSPILLPCLARNMSSGGRGKAVIGADCGSGKAVIVVGGVVVEVVEVVVVGAGWGQTWNLSRQSRPAVV